MLRILLAEDNDLVRDGLEKLINQESDITVVSAAADGEEALAKINYTDVDIVVTDLNLPKIDGFGLMEELRHRKPEIRIVVFSALTNTTYIARAFRAGASAYLTKDNSSDELIFALRHVGMGKKYLSADVSISIFEKHHQFD